MVFCIDIFVDEENFAVLADVVCPAEGDSPDLCKEAVFCCRLFFGIAQNDVVEVEFFCKFCVVLGFVGAGCEINDVELFQIIVRTERFALGCSAACEGFRIPRDDDGLFAFVVGKFVCFSVAAFEFEVRGGVADFEVVGLGVCNGHNADKEGC